ncbi:unnamed protein product [Calypogeia fissa]
MRGTVWHRAIRPTIRLASLIIFAFFIVSRGAGFVGNGPVNIHKLTHRSDSLGNIIQTEYGRSSRNAGEGNNGDTSRSVRHLQEHVGEDEATQSWKDEVPQLYSQEFKYEGQISQPLDSSRENGSEFKVGLLVKKVTEGSACTDARDHPGYSDSCSYVKATPECRSGTLIEYMEVFYCVFSGTPGLAYVALIFLLAALFYSLGHTAHHFFCVSMDKLSQILKMSSTLAGVTLLPFGNGGPDVFASIAAFVGHSGQGQVGLNSVLGGALFVSSVVAGSVTLAMISANPGVQLDQADFVRDVGFFLFTLTALTAILFDGKIHFWEALAYISIYAVYVSIVATVECIKWRFICSDESLRALLHSDDEPGNVGEGQKAEIDNPRVGSPPVQSKLAPHEDVESAQNGAPINNPADVSSAAPASLPGGRRLAIPNGDIDRQESLIPILQARDEQGVEEFPLCSFRGFCSYFIAWPLALPRRLTIPLIEDPPRWSKVYAVCSVTFAPVLLAMVWDGKDDGPFGSARAQYCVALGVGSMLGGLSLIFLKGDRPPQRCRAWWAAGGFIMSMVWFYVIAMELVAVLVALGAIWKIDPAIFGLTVLAWGNSIGDMMSNLALVSLGDHRMQTSFSGCYAGPMFNTLIGLGVSFVLESWKTYPDPFAIPGDSSLFITLAFLVIGLLFALAMLLPRDMQPTKAFGVGLMSLYTSFLVTRLLYQLDIRSILLNGGLG